jgi:hypothetical protein
MTDLSIFRARPGKDAIGGIWLTVADEAFPATGWPDFVVIVLGWWAAALIRLRRGKVGAERVHFMDGPHSVEVSILQPGKLTLKMFSGASGGKEVGAGQADIDQFIQEVVIQSRKVLSECRSWDWWSSDAEALERSLADLDRSHSAEG